MMLLLWVKCLEKLYPPEVDLKAASQKIERLYKKLRNRRAYLRKKCINKYE